jgi:beta-N-acetylhexosaminidase
MLVEVLRTQGERNVVVVTRRAHLSNEQRRAVDALLTAAPEAVVVSALEPFDAVCFPQARTLLCSFGDDEVNVEAVADVLTGRSVARGSLPVALAKPAPA